MLEELRRHREMVQGRIQKSFESDGLNLNILKTEETEIFKAQETEEQEASVTDLIKAGVLEYDDSIEKAVYADTAENRKLGRVGQEYHRGKGKKVEEKTGKKGVNENDKTPEKKQKKQNENTNSSANVSVEGLEKTLDGIDGAEVESVKYKPTVLLQPAVRDRRGRVVQPAITENPDLPYIDISIDGKKSLDQAIEAINKKYGVKITKDDFDHNRRFGVSLYTISVNPKTGEFGHPHRGFTNKMMDDYKKEWKKKQKDR